MPVHRKKKQEWERDVTRSLPGAFSFQRPPLSVSYLRPSACDESICIGPHNRTVLFQRTVYSSRGAGTRSWAHWLGFCHVQSWVCGFVTFRDLPLFRAQMGASSVQRLPWIQRYARNHTHPCPWYIPDLRRGASHCGRSRGVFNPASGGQVFLTCE